MTRQLFGTDGIRGPAGEYPLDHEGMVRIGKAVGIYFTGDGAVLVGWDPRESSEELVAGLAEGLEAVGAEVRKLGVIPTPGLAYLSAAGTVKAGVMITASHNPYTDNGVKVFRGGGRKLTDDDQAKLNELIDSDIPDATPGMTVDDTGAIKVYEDFLVDSAGGTSLTGLKLAVDTANGATSGIAARVFDRLGADVTALSDKPDGRNINVRCGATDPAALQQAVREQSLDGGVAFDGDGDRVIMVDSEGRQLTGDHIIYILAVTGSYEGVAVTIMSNQGLETALARRGIDVRRTPVGDRNVLDCLDETGYTLGGEQSGHIILRELNGTGDGLLAAIRVLAATAASGKSLAEWHDGLELLPQALVSIPFPDKHLLESPEFKGYIEEESAGLGAAGRLSVRASGTEPKVRVMVESNDAQERASKIADKLSRMAADKKEK